MARPAKVDIVTSSAGWDASLDQNMDSMFNAPLPVFRAADLATLSASWLPASYDDCVAIATDTGIVYISDGAAWNRLVPLMANDGAPTATTLRDELVSVGLMAP